MPRRWFQAPIDYEVYVRVTTTHPALRPGLRAKVKIITQSARQVVQAPLTSIVRRDNDYYVLAAKDGQWTPRRVQVGADNDQRVIIESGLDAGEFVAVNPDRFVNEVEFPASVVQPDADSVAARR